MMEKYIDWQGIWQTEILPQLKDESLHSKKDWELIENFKRETNLDFDIGDCVFDDEGLFFQFSETGGQNESDTQGWYRLYWFKVEISSDFLISEIGYEWG